VGLVPRTGSPSRGIDTLLSCVLIRDVTMRIPWATASRSGRTHHSHGVHLPICSSATTRKGNARSVSCPVEYRDGSCGTLWYRKGRSTRCDNKVRCACTSSACSPVSPRHAVLQASHAQRDHQGYCRGSVQHAPHAARQPVSRHACVSRSSPLVSISWQIWTMIASILLRSVLSVRSVAQRLRVAIGNKIGVWS
jgi:hypothetical protein